VAILAFFPCLFQGQAYFDNDLLAQFGPWRAFLKDQLAQGHFPLWNPYLLGGTPFFADPQNMLLYPFNWLTLPFSVPMGLTVFFFIHMVWAAVGMHLWLRSFGLSKQACRAGALLFSLSGFFWLEIIHPPVLAAFAWLPWLFLSLEGLAKDAKPLNAFWAGLCFAMLFLCGSFQVTAGAFYGGLAYFLFRCLQCRKSFSPFNFSTFLLLAAFLVWGALPLLGQLIPTMEFAKLSDRANPDAQTEKANAQLSLNPATLGQFLFPRMTLKEGDDMAVALQSGKDAPDFPMAANWGYLGIWLPFLVWGAWRRKDKSLALFFSVFSLIVLVFCFGRFTPVHHWLSSLLPGLSLIRVPYRFLYLYVLAASVLAALGMDQWLKEAGQTKIPVWRKAPAGYYAAGLFVFIFYHGGNFFFEITGLVLGLLGFLMLSRPSPIIRLLLALGLLFPLLLNGWNDFQPDSASNFDFTTRSMGAVEAGRSLLPNRAIFLTDEMGYPIRVHGRNYVLAYPQNDACALGIKNFGGYNPLVLQAKREIGGLPLAVAMQFGAVDGVLTHTDHGPMPGFKKESYPPYFLYRRQQPLPCAYAPSSVISVTDSGQQLAQLQKPDFDLSKSALYPDYLPTDWDTSSPTAARALNCGLEDEESGHQRFSVDLGRGSLVVFCETMYPGWRAWVDGNSAPLHTADLVLRSLYLTAGHHEVEFKFEPAWWTPIRVGLALWLVLTLSALLVLLRRNFFAILQNIYYSIGGHGLGRIKVLRWAYGTLFKLFKPKSVMVQGHRMWLDDRDTLQLAVNQVYEPVETALLKDHLKPGQAFVDVGANIGYYTLLAARIVGPQGRVYAFEPDSANFKLLGKNTAANGYGNVTAVNKALSNKSGTARLYINPVNRGDHRIYDSKDGRPSVEIETVTLDRFFEKLDKKVHFIKMDVQGAEAAALGGMKGLIRRNKGLKLVTEFSPGSLKAFGADPKKYLRDLQALGFRFQEISEKHGTVKPVTPAQLLKRPWGGSEDYTNLFCVK